MMDIAARTDQQRPLLFIHVSAILGGAEKAFLDLLKQLPAPVRANSYVLMPEVGPLQLELTDLVPKNNLSVRPLPKLFSQGTRKRPLWSLLNMLLSLPQMFQYLWSLIHWIREFQSPSLYVHGIKFHMISLAVRPFYQGPLIWHLQDFFPELPFVKLYLRAISLVSSGPDLIICNSQAVLLGMKKNLPKSWKTRLICVHNAVDVNEFSAALVNQRNHLGARHHPVRIAMVAMLTPWKGQEVFIEALADLHRRQADLLFEAEIIGDEVYKTAGESGFKVQLQKKIEELGLSHKIKLRGFIREVPQVLKQADIVVHCSTLPEPFGKVIVEAMSSECAVIATAAGGVPEIIDHRVDGILVRPGNIQDLSQALELLIREPELRTQLGTRARQKVLAKFSATQFAASIQQALKEGDLI